jgi:hypothetical protein
MTRFVSYFLRKLVRLRSLPQLLIQRTAETAYWNGEYVRIYCAVHRGIWRKKVVQIEAWTQDWSNVAVAVAVAVDVAVAVAVSVAVAVL